MPIDFRCPCGKSLRVKDELAGKRVKCPACGQVVTILASQPASQPALSPAVPSRNPGAIVSADRPNPPAAPDRRPGFEITSTRPNPDAERPRTTVQEASSTQTPPRSALIDPALKRILLRHKWYAIFMVSVGGVVGYLLAAVIGYVLDLRGLGLFILSIWFGVLVLLGAAAGGGIVLAFALQSAAAFRRWRAGLPPLIGAAVDGNSDEIRRLLEAGEDVNQKAGPDGPTALLLAVYEGQADIAELLLAKGADVNLAGPVTPDHSHWYKGVIPLHAAVLSHHETTPFISLLLAHGADVNAKDDKGRTPLFYAAGGPEDEIFHSASQGQMELRVKALLAGKADVRLAPGGITPLHQACKYGSLTMVDDLIRHGADVNARTSMGRTPLHCAIGPIWPNSEIVKALLARGADINAQDSKGMTALMEAVNYPGEQAEGDLSCLLPTGARLDLKNKNGETALDLAERHKHSSYAKQIRNAGQTR